MFGFNCLQWIARGRRARCILWNCSFSKSPQDLLHTRYGFLWKEDTLFIIRTKVYLGPSDKNMLIWEVSNWFLLASFLVVKIFYIPFQFKIFGNELITFHYNSRTLFWALFIVYKQLCDFLLTAYAWGIKNISCIKICSNNSLFKLRKCWETAWNNRKTNLLSLKLLLKYKVCVMSKVLWWNLLKKKQNKEVHYERNYTRIQKVMSIYRAGRGEPA